MSRFFKKYQVSLVIIIFLTLLIGHLIPYDFKVVYGFCCGLGAGAYLLPRVIKERLDQNIRKVWRADQ